MVCENLSRYYPMVMKFSGYLPLYEDASAIDFGPDRSTRWVGHALQVGLDQSDCSSVCEWDKFSGVLPLRRVQ